MAHQNDEKSIINYLSCMVSGCTREVPESATVLGSVENNNCWNTLRAHVDGDDDDDCKRLQRVCPKKVAQSGQFMRQLNVN